MSENGRDDVLRDAELLAAIGKLCDLEWQALKCAEDGRRAQERREHPAGFDARLLIG